MRLKISPELAKEYAGYIQAVDPYDHPIAIHHAGKAIAMKIGKGEVFALPGEIYAVYLPSGGQATLDLTGCPGRFVRQWYNPRQGVFEGPAETLFGGKRIDLGVPPNKPSEDWTALLKLIKP